jgi:hypothetical protein
MRRVLLALAIAGCAEGIPPGSPTGGDNGGNGGNGNSGAPPPTTAPIGTFGVDYYYLPYESDYAGPSQSAMTDTSCTTLADVPSNFYQDVVSDGIGRLADGRVLTVTGACSCAQSTTCFAVAQTPWGTGANGRALVPFRSIAVSGHTLAVGTKVYAPDLAGLTMPGTLPAGGFVHDGCLVVDDRGGDRTHIDLFTGLRSYKQTLSGQITTDLQLYPADGYCL